MNFKKLSLLVACASALALTGCTSVSMRASGYDLSRIDSFVTKNETTISDVRALMGTPTVFAQTKEGETILGYALTGHNSGAAFARNFGKGMLTTGIGSKKLEETQKNAIFKFNQEGKLVDLQKDGVAYLFKLRFTTWNECERRLTPEEINSPIVYSDAEICKLYAEEVAAQKSISVKDVDIEEEFEGCNLPCQVERSINRFHKDVINVDNTVDELPGDGSRFREVFP